MRISESLYIKIQASHSLTASLLQALANVRLPTPLHTTSGSVAGAIEPLLIMSVALVIGSNGFIGGYVCQRLIAAGWQVIGLDNINLYKPAQWKLYMRHFEIRQNTQLRGMSAFYRMDASLGSEVASIIAKHKPSLVLNLGGTPVADVCKVNIDEAVHSIYLLNSNLLQSLKQHDALDRYVYVSSSMVYGDFPPSHPMKTLRNDRKIRTVPSNSGGKRWSSPFTDSSICHS